VSTLNDRKNALLFEKDGDFNPGWLLFILFSALGAGISVGCLIVAMQNEKAWPALIAGLSFVAFAMLCTAIIVVPVSRAKLLANGRNVGKAVSAIAAAGGNVWNDDERDPQWDASDDR
jgi:amino acid transporter